ncbi:MAG: hypothetical protein ACHQ1G_08240 [Planctomycetota bacterium]
MRVVAWILLLAAATACDEPAGKGAPPAADAAQSRGEACCVDATARLEAYLGKKFKAPVPVAMKTQEEMAALLRGFMEQEVPPDLAEAAQKVAERLHLVPRGYDIMAKELEMLGQGVAGLYDPDTDRFYVVRGVSEPDSLEFRVTVAHELVHAYRDVDKDYWPRSIRLSRTNTDEMMALTFLVEGDATMLGNAIGDAIEGNLPEPMVEKASRPEETVETWLAVPEVAEFPLVLKETLMAPYVEGHAFAGEVFRAGGKEALGKAYDRPPRSTEQVLHPEKYLSKPDEPMEFEGGEPLPALGDGWRLVWTDVMGEFDVRVLLAEAFGRSWARDAAAGWDGARYWLCEKQGVPSFFGAVTAWDTEKDAREFAEAWADWALRRDGKAGEVGGRGGEWRLVTKEGLVIVRQAGTSVFVADGVPEDRVDAVFRALTAARPVERKAE